MARWSLDDMGCSEPHLASSYFLGARVGQEGAQDPVGGTDCFFPGFLQPHPAASTLWGLQGPKEKKQLCLLSWGPQGNGGLVPQTVQKDEFSQADEVIRNGGKK